MRRENVLILHTIRGAFIFAFLALTASGSLNVVANTARKPFLAPSAAVTISAGTPYLGENFDIILTFDNTNPTDTGYGPFIDLYIPHTGSDGFADTDGDFDEEPNPPFDGISPPPPATQYSASYDGSSLIVFTLEFPNDDGDGFGCVDHPLALDESGFFIEVCGNAGDQLVVIQLPFGSFTPEQPEVTVIVPAHMSELANLGEPLVFYARGGFQYGATPTVDWCCTDPPDTTILSDVGAPDTWAASQALLPNLISIDKSDPAILPTGPNYVETFTITVDIAEGQTIGYVDDSIVEEDVIITDVLPGEIVYMDNLIVSPEPLSVDEPDASNGFTLTVVYDYLVGVDGVDISVSYDFYVADILNSTTGAIQTIENEVFLEATWEPIDPRNQPGASGNASIGPGIGVINAAPLEFDKTSSLFIDPGGNGVSEGDIVEHTLTLFVSDHFALGDLLISADEISDGQHFYNPAGFEPEITVNSDGTSTTADFSDSNYLVTCNYTGGPGAECDIDDGAANDGTTTLTFDVSQQVIDSGIQTDGQLIGDHVDDGDFLNDQATSYTITYYTQVLDSYTDIAGEDSLNHGDEISNTADYSALLLDTDTCAAGSCTSDHGVTLSGSAATIQEVLAPTASKGIVAVEGETCGTPAFSECVGVSVSPKETVTYRVIYDLNTGDYENLVLTDFLPLPIMQVDDPDADGAAGPAWAKYAGADPTPPTGTWMRGPADTQFAAQGVDPNVTHDSTNNTLIFDFGTFADPNNLHLTVDLLFTITVSSDPYADGLLMTNQLLQSDSDTTGVVNSSSEIGQLTLTEPVLVSNKTAVSTDNVNVFLTTPPPITFDIPGIVPDLDAPWSGGTINSDYLGANNGNLNINISDVDGGDLVKFAIVIQNIGSSPNGAYDIVIKDTLPAGFIVPGIGSDPDGINLQVYRGDGIPLNYTPVGADGLLGDGIQIVDPANDPSLPPTDPDYGKGACQGHDATNGKNVIVITYDLMVDPFVRPSQVILNQGEVLQYAGSEGGEDHLEEPLQDFARTITASPGIAKELTGSEIDLGLDSSNTTSEAVIGELVSFQVVVTVPEGEMQNFVIEDSFLDNGAPYFAFVSLDSFTVSDVDTDENPADSVTDTGIHFTGSSTPIITDNGGTITIDLDTVYNTDTNNSVAETITVEYTVVVLNVVENQMPSTKDNFAFLQWVSLGSNGFPVNRQIGPVSASVDVIEPLLSVSKSVTNVTKGLDGDYDAGDVIEYTIEIEHLDGSTDAYEVELLDELPNGIGNTVITGAVITGVTDTSTVNPVDSSFFELVCADPGCSAPNYDTLRTVASFDWPADSAGLITVTLQGVLGASLGPSDLVRNEANIFWSSLDGTVTDRSGDYVGPEDGERDGSGGLLNDYQDQAQVDLSIEEAGAIKYLHSSDASHTIGADLTIGEIATFVIEVGLPEGETSDLVVIDLVDTGMQYIPGSGEIRTTAADALGYLAEDFAGTIAAPTITTAGGSGDLVSFTFDSIMVDLDNNVNNNAFVIVLDVVILNEAGNQTENPTITNDVEMVVDSITVPGNSVELEIVEPQLLLTKTVDDDTPILGQTVTFTLTVEHTAASDSDAFDIVVTDLLPAGLDYVASSITAPAGWSSSDVGNPTLSWGGDLSQAAGSVTLSYQAVVNAVSNNPGDTLTNDAVAKWTSLDADSANDGTSEERTGPADAGDTLNDYESTSSVTSTVTNIDLEITKDDGGVTGVPNSDITYSITVTNSGSDTATNIVITEIVPDYTTFNPVASPVGWTCSAGGVAGDSCTYYVASLDGGGIGTVDFVVTVDAVVPIGVTSTTNNVSVADDGTHGTDQTPDNNSASDDTPLLAAPDIAITKDDGRTAVSPGTTTTYMLTILNLGDQDALGVGVTDTIPDDTSFVSASQNPDGLDAAYDDPTRSVSWPVFDLAAGASETVSVTVLVDDPYTGGPTITNTAHAEDDGTNGEDSNTENNDAEDTDNVLTLLSKTIIATSEGSTPTELNGDENVTIGEILIYQLVFDLPAGANLDAIALSDTLGSGLAFVDCLSVTPTSPSVTTDISGAPSTDFSPVCAGVAVNDIVNPTDPTNPIGLGREVVFDFGNVVNAGAVDAQVVTQYRAVVLEVPENLAADILENTVEMGWDGGDLMTENANQVTIIEPDLALEKTVDPLTMPASGGTVTYTIRVNHTVDSTSDAFDLVVEDSIPAQLSYVPGSLQYVSGIVPTSLDDSNLPNLRIEWDALPRLPLGTDSVIEFQAEFTSLPAGVEIINEAFLVWSSLPGDQTAPSSEHNPRSVERVYDPPVLAWFEGVSDDAGFITAGLPKTGFPAGVITDIPTQPDSIVYSAVDGLHLEIDKLGVNASIIGIPLQNGEWDLTWLWNQVGYLDGTAYPTWSGNTAITAHVYLPNGEPGPFVELNRLVWGDKIIIRSGGLEYVYHVRTVQRVWPDDVSVLRHEDYPWLTLITCQDFNQQTGEYNYRTAVRAVLVAVR